MKDKKVAIIIVVAIGVGLIHILPHIIFASYSQGRGLYYPIYFSELAYASQVKEVLEGHVAIGDSQILEHKDVFPSLHPYIPVFLLAMLSVITGSLESSFIVSDFIFPAIIFLLIVYFSKKIGNSYELSTIAGLATIFAYSAFTNIPPITPYLAKQLIQKIFLTDITSPLSFFRTPNPQISFVFLLIPLFTLYFFFLKPTLKKALIVSIFGCLLFSTYYYHAIFFYFVLTFVFLFSLMQRNWRQAKYLFAILTLMTLVVLYFKFLSTWSPYNNSQIMAGYFKTHYIDWIFSARYVFALSFFYLLLRKTNRNLLIFSTAITLSALTCMNLQVITGWTIVPGHWPQTTVEPVLVALTVIAIGYVLRKKNLYAAYLAFIIIILLHALIFQIKFSQRYKSNTVVPAETYETIMWLKKNADKDSVVLSLDAEKFQAFVTVMTQANNFIPVYDYHYASLDEVWLRNLYASKVYSLDLNTTKFIDLPIFKYSLDQAYNVNKYKHYSLYEYPAEMLTKIGSCLPSICSGFYIVPANTESFYKTLYAGLSLSHLTYTLNYVIYSNYEKSIGAIPPIGDVVFSSGNTQIYKFPDHLQ